MRMSETSIKGNKGADSNAILQTWYYLLTALKAFHLMRLLRTKVASFLSPCGQCSNRSILLWWTSILQFRVEFAIWGSSSPTTSLSWTTLTAQMVSGNCHLLYSIRQALNVFQLLPFLTMMLLMVLLMGTHQQDSVDKEREGCTGGCKISCSRVHSNRMSSWVEQESSVHHMLLRKTCTTQLSFVIKYNSGEVLMNMQITLRGGHTHPGSSNHMSYRSGNRV